MVCRAAYRGRRVAVTGAGGYLGSALAAALARDGADVLAVSRHTTPPVGRILIADVASASCWSDILAHAEVVFHLADDTARVAPGADDASRQHSAVRPLIHLAEIARRLSRSPRVILASTVTVYAADAPLPVPETATIQPPTPYDCRKRQAEQSLELATQRGDIAGIALRLPNVYGPSPRPNAASDRGVLNRLAKRALEGADLEVFGNGRYLRDYVYIDDVVQAFLIVGASPTLQGTCNVGSGRGVAVADAFEELLACANRLTGRRGRLRAVPWPEGSDPIEARNFVADTGRLRSLTGWAPTVSFEDGVARLMNAIVRGAVSDHREATP